MPPNGVPEGLSHLPIIPEKMREAFGRPEDFAKNAVDKLQSFLQKNNIGLNTLQQMRPGQQEQQRPTNTFERVIAWLKSMGSRFEQTGWMRITRGQNRRGRSRGPEALGSGRVSPEAPPIGTAEAMQRLQNLRTDFPQMQFQMLDRAGVRPLAIDADPAAFEQFCAHNSIRGMDYESYVKKMETNGQRLAREAATRPGWENADAWKTTVVCDGLRIWAFNPTTNETCVATGGQLLFGQGNPTAVLGGMRRNRDGDPSTTMRTINNMTVQWDHTAMGERFVTQNAGVRDEVFSRHNDGLTRERFSGGGRPDFVMHTDKATVARVNAPGAMLPGSMRLEDMRGVQQFPQGTFARMANGEWLGKTSYEVQKRGLNAYVDMLAKLPDRELASYISGVMFDQNEDAYGPGAPNMRSLNIVFDRTDRTVADILKSGYGDCRGVAKLVELVWRRKGYRCVTAAVEKDHMMAIRIVPSGNPQAPFVAVGIGNNGYWDKFAPGRTPGEAMANTWTDEKYGRPGAPMIMNDKMNLAQSSYDAIGKAILNNA